MSPLHDLIATHAVITTEDASAFLESRGVYRRRRRDRELAALCARGELIRVQRGVYARADPDDAELYPLAARLAPDAILGLHSALAAHGVVPTTGARCIYFTRLGGPARGPVWRGMRFQRISHPVALARAGKRCVETELWGGWGQPAMRVTTTERAFVDVLDRPRLTGDWPAVIELLGAIPALDLERVIRYTGCLGNATTAAKVGWMLERFQHRLRVSASILCRLEHMRPRGPHYLSRSQRVSGRYVARWNLVVPPLL